MQEPEHVGLILPSSNVVLEEVIQSGHIPDGGAIYHMARLSVADVTLSAASRAQFEETALETALDQVMETEPSRVIFAGTAGAWLGLDRERDWCDRAERRYGIPVSTTSLLCLAYLRGRRIERLALFTPFVAEVHAAVVRTFESEGFTIEGGGCLELTSSRRMATVSPSSIAALICDARPTPFQASLSFCTNFRGLEAQAQLPDRFVPVSVMDSVEITLAAVSSDLAWMSGAQRIAGS